MYIETGIDIISISRIKCVIDKFGLRFLQRFLLPIEISFLLKNASGIESSLLRCDNYLLTNNGIAIFDKDYLLSMPLEFSASYLSSFKMESVAGLWSAKEAFSKALGVGIGKDISFHDICIYKASKGRPCIAIEREKSEVFGLHRISLSITHDSNIAVASCVIASYSKFDAKS